MAGIKNQVSADEALAMLKAGNERFAADQPLYERHDLARRQELEKVRPRLRLS